MPPSRIHEYPFSLNLPPELRLPLEREAAKRGGMPLGQLIRMAVSEWLALQNRRKRRQKQLEKQEEVQQQGGK